MTEKIFVLSIDTVENTIAPMLADGWRVCYLISVGQSVIIVVSKFDDIENSPFGKNN